MAITVELEQQAQKFYTQGDREKTLQVCQQILAENPEHPEALDMLSKAAMADETFEAAEQYLTVLTKLYPEDAVVGIKLGYVQEKQGKLDVALETYLGGYDRYPENPVIFLYLGYLYVLKGDAGKAAEIFSLGEDIDGNILKGHLNLNLGEIIRRRSRIAEQTVHEVLTKLHLDTIKGMDRDGDLKRIYDAVWPQIDVREFDYKCEEQKPLLFYIPDLPPTPYFKTEDLDWVGGIETSFDAIKREVLENLDMAGDGKPYLPAGMSLAGDGWDKIVGQMAWGSVHLYKQGKPNDEAIAKFPLLMKAMRNIPLAIIGGNPSEIFISVLKPETRIPPHFGVSNNVFTVHFPLVVPAGCGVRVGKDTIMHKEGEIIAFDDSYRHEAWNPGQEIRIVLIFEVWHPELAENEQKAISATFEARQKWLDNRKVK